MTPSDYPGETILVAGDPAFTAELSAAFQVNRVNAHVVIVGNRLDRQLVDAYDPDLILLAGYMQQVPDQLILGTPTWGFHPSLLPRYRGGSAVKWQLHHGETQLGCTIYQLEPGKLDAGPIVVQRELIGYWAELVGDPTPGNLYRALRTLGCYAFVGAARAWLDETYTLTPQDEEAATWHPRLAPGQSPTEYLADAGDAPAA